jgi:hypothetical protein
MSLSRQSADIAASGGRRATGGVVSAKPGDYGAIGLI